MATTPSKVIYSNTFVTLETFPAWTPQGEEYPHHRFFTGEGYGAVIVPLVLLRGIRHVGLVRQRRPAASLETSLELPRGNTDDLEEREARRELGEELGLVGLGTMIFLGTIHPDSGISSTEVGVWACLLPPEAVDLSKDHREEETALTVEWLPAGLALGACSRGGQITCGITMAALLKAQVEGHLSNIY